MKPPITVAALTAADPARGVCVYHHPTRGHTWLTPEEAEALAKSLVDAARVCRQASAPTTFIDRDDAVAATRVGDGSGATRIIRAWAAAHYLWPSLHPDAPEGYAFIDKHHGQNLVFLRNSMIALHNTGGATDEEFYPSTAQHTGLEDAFANGVSPAPDEEPFKTWVVKYNAEPANYTTTHVKLVSAWHPEEAVALARDHLLRIGHDPARYVFQAAYEYRAPPPGKVL